MFFICICQIVTNMKKQVAEEGTIREQQPPQVGICELPFGENWKWSIFLMTISEEIAIDQMFYLRAKKRKVQRSNNKQKEDKMKIEWEVSW